MQLTAADIEGIPARNVRVPVADFAALWVAVESYSEQQGREGVTDWYVGGVVVTCRWLARATVRPRTVPWRPANSPIGERTNMAYEELIQAEAVAAEALAGREPRPRWLVARPGWIEAITATFAWAWWQCGPAPLQVQQSVTA